LLVVGCWLLVVGYWLLVISCWLFVVGYWLLVLDIGEVRMRSGRIDGERQP
jgi:hypothetical protein